MDLLLIVAHAPLAHALRAVAVHAFPELGGAIAALDVAEGETPEQTQAQLRSMLPSQPQAETLILTDVFGATPCNAALKVAGGARVRVVAGVNVPMLWRALCYRNEPLDLLVGRVVDGGTQGVMQVASARQQNQAPRSGEDDQIQHHDQQ